jgi:hypothetical protein
MTATPVSHSRPVDGLDAAIAALDPEDAANEWRLNISHDVEYTLSSLVQAWPSLRDDDDLLTALRALIGPNPFRRNELAAGLVTHEACVRLLVALLQVEAEADSLSYGAVFQLDGALSDLTDAIADLKAELGSRAVAS